jgi:hypothetical protein
MIYWTEKSRRVSWRNEEAEITARFAVKQNSPSSKYFVTPFVKNFSLFHILVLESQNRVKKSDMCIQNNGEDFHNEHSFTPYVHWDTKKLYCLLECRLKRKTLFITFDYVMLTSYICGICFVLLYSACKSNLFVLAVTTWESNP